MTGKYFLFKTTYTFSNYRNYVSLNVLLWFDAMSPKISIKKLIKFKHEINTTVTENYLTSTVHFSETIKLRLRDNDLFYQYISNICQKCYTSFESRHLGKLYDRSK